MATSDLETEFEALRRTWRNVTREWLTARNAMARLQDAAVIDLRAAASASRRLEQAERQREALNRRLEELQRRLEARGA
jgi:predicted  nucleic acid-binding Zn-ribbon protein